jgi:hypothetical protein
VAQFARLLRIREQHQPKKKKQLGSVRKFHMRKPHEKCNVYQETIREPSFKFKGHQKNEREREKRRERKTKQDQKKRKEKGFCNQLLSFSKARSPLKTFSPLFAQLSYTFPRQIKPSEVGIQKRIEQKLQICQIPSFPRSHLKCSAFLKSPSAKNMYLLMCLADIQEKLQNEERD